MEICQGIKERFGLESKRFTTALVVCLIALPVSLLLALTLYRSSSTYGLIGGLGGGTTQIWGEPAQNVTVPCVAETGICKGNAQNVTLSCVNAKNLSCQLTSSSDNKIRNETSVSKSNSSHDSSQHSGSIEGSFHINSSTEPIKSEKGQGSRNNTSQLTGSTEVSGPSKDFSLPTEVSKAPDTGKSVNKLANGLFASGFDESSCRSRYQSFLYRKALPHKPSAYLISKLRNYEKLHQHCGPYGKSYSVSVKRLEARYKHKRIECKYLVWIPNNGLGNRMISMAASFLYALVTDRVLLLDHGSDMDDLFCEPFPKSSWLMPKNFPFKKQFRNKNLRDHNGLGTMSRNDVNNMSTASLPSYLYLDLGHGVYDRDLDRYWNFYCDEGQALLQNIPWLILLSDQYFAPSFFLMPSFKQEVSQLFPQKEALFHFLGRYLFNPANQAWGLITRFYDAYLSKADERIGLQIRVFHPKGDPFQTNAMDLVLACTLKGKLLPEVDNRMSPALPSRNRTSKAVLVTSLLSTYYENISAMYWTKPTVTGEVIGVFQPSHEEYQHFGDNMHNMKAWAEMYLLSLCDVLVTTGSSTFGYVPQGLAGLKAWILRKPGRGKSLDRPCQRAMSMEPCFHFPPNFDCSSRSKTDTGALVPFIRHCEDRKTGVKLVSNREHL